MATYSDYLAVIDGKAFSSNYFYRIDIINETSNVMNGQYSFSGVVDGFSSPALGGTITATNFDEGIFRLADQTFQIHGAGADSQSLVFKLVTTDIHSSQTYYVLSNSGTFPTGAIAYNSSNPYNSPNPTCFAAGTRIATLAGDVAIESLVIGDVIKLANGGAAPVKWMGKRHLRCAASPWKGDVFPILIERHALGLFVPSHDLMVSPGHSIQVEDDLLIQAGYLVNGETIRQVEAEQITYWHIELENHSIILANNTPVESYIDVGNRADFENGGAVSILHPRFKEQQLAKYCMPVAQDDEARASYRTKFAERAAALKATLNGAA